MSGQILKTAYLGSAAFLPPEPQRQEQRSIGLLGPVAKFCISYSGATRNSLELVHFVEVVYFSYIRSKVSPDCSEPNN